MCHTSFRTCDVELENVERKLFVLESPQFRFSLARAFECVAFTQRERETASGLEVVPMWINKQFNEWEFNTTVSLEMPLPVSIESELFAMVQRLFSWIKIFSFFERRSYTFVIRRIVNSMHVTTNFFFFSNNELAK